MSDNFNKITLKEDQNFLSKKWWEVVNKIHESRDDLNLNQQVKSTRTQLEFLNSEEWKEYFAQKMGSYLHEEWRKTRLNYWPEKEFKKWETVIKINKVEYVFNGTKNGRWEFIITEAGKETAKQLYSQGRRTMIIWCLKDNINAYYDIGRGASRIKCATLPFETLKKVVKIYEGEK